MRDADGLLTSLNVARQKRLILINGVPQPIGIFKRPVEDRLDVDADGLLDDRIADLSVHGGVDKAVYSYGIEDYEWWARELGHETGPGLFGENLRCPASTPATP